MSSILRALKKLEEESPDQGTPSSRDIQMKRLVARPDRSGAGKYKFIAAVSLLILLAGVTWLILRSNSSSQATAVQPDRSTSSASSGKATEPAPVSALPAQKQTALAPQVNPSSTAASQHMAQQNKVQPQTQERVTQSALSEPPKPMASKKPVPINVPKQVKEIREKKLPVKSNRPISSQEPRTSAQVPPSPKAESSSSKPSRPQLKLTGILWSQKPGRSVALMGDRYLKEGDTVEGITIIKIEKNSVTLKLNDDQWKILLKK